MKTPLLCICAALLAGCGGERQAAAPTPPPDAAMPVVTPIQSGQRLVHDLDRTKQQARDRAKAFDEVVGRDR